MSETEERKENWHILPHTANLVSLPGIDLSPDYVYMLAVDSTTGTAHRLGEYAEGADGRLTLRRSFDLTPQPPAPKDAE